MDNSQRKQIIDQVMDLVKTRGSVSIDNVEAQGVTFSDLDRNIVHNVSDEGFDSIIQWDCVSYTVETEDFPSYINFLDLYADGNALVNHRTFLSLSSLTDSGISYTTMSKFETIIEPIISTSAPISITGNFQASVYLDDLLVISHNYPTGDPNGDLATTTSSVPIPVSEGGQHVIKVIVYGKENNQPNSIKLESELFKHIRLSLLPNVLRPLNAFATNSNVDNITVSWEQNPTQSLNGGGVEVWGKLSSVNTEYNLIEKVPYPSTSYIHNSRSGSAIVNENNRFLTYTPLDGEDGQVVRVGNATNGEINVHNWEVFYDAEDVTCSLILDSDLEVNSLNVNSTVQNASLLSNSEGHILPNNSDNTHINTDNPVLFNYSSTYNLKTSTTQEVRSNTVVSNIEITWGIEYGLSLAEVECVVYRGGTPTVHTVLATDAKYTETLSAGDVASIIADPDWLHLEFRTSASMLNGDDPLLRVFLNTMLLSFTDNYTTDIEFYTDYIRCSYDNWYDVEYIYANDNILLVTSVYMYDENKNYISYTNTESFEYVTEGSWTVANKRVYVQSETAAYIKVHTRLLLVGSISSESVFKSISVSKKSTIPLSPETEFSYKLRNYTNDLRYSEFTTSFIGKTSQQVYNLALTSENDYISHFKANKVGAITTTSMQYVDLNLVGMNGSVIPIETTGVNSGNSDFTFTYRPLLSNCVIYDTFNNDNRIINENSTQVFPIDEYHVTAEESPARAVAIWTPVSTVGAISGIVTDNKPPYFGFWENTFPNYQDFQTYVKFEGEISAPMDKRYFIGNTDSFYRNLFGNPDDPEGNFLFKKPSNKTKFSLGLIFRVRDIQVDKGLTILKEDNLFKLEFTDIGQQQAKGLKCTINGVDGPVVELQHTLPVNLPDIDNVAWMYVHVSADRDALNDSNRTYVSVHNISRTYDSTVPNTMEEVRVTGSQSQYFRWQNASWVYLGIPTPITGSSTINMDVDTFYLTCDIIERNIIDDNIAIPLIDERNPYFPSFGLKSGYDATFYAEGLTIGSNEEDQEEGEIVVGGGLLTDEATVTIDWEEPDGTMYIFRDTFTIRQDEVDSYNSSQPLYTYSKMNKLYVDMTSKYSSINSVRFANQTSDWGRWKSFNNELLYPWELYDLGYPGDTTEGGIRTVYCQVITDAGVTSDFILKDNHKDTILYNPLASIGGIESFNYLEGLSGWSISMAGDAEFNSVWIRGNSKMDGRVLNSGLMNTGWVKGQLPEGKVSNNKSMRREVSSESLWRGLLCNRVGLETGVPYSGNLYYTEYSSDFQLDLTNEDIVYIPGIQSSMHSSSITRVDMRMDQDEYPFTEGEHSNKVFTMARPQVDWAVSSVEDSGFRYLPQIAVDENHLFVADSTVLYKVDKVSMVLVDSKEFALHPVTFDSLPFDIMYSGRITGMSLTYSKNKTKNLYLYFGFSNDSPSGQLKTGTSCILNPDTLEIKEFHIQTQAGGLNHGGSRGPTGYHSMFAGNDFDCNGEFSVSVHHTSNGIYVKPLDEDGLSQTDKDTRTVIVDGTTYRAWGVHKTWVPYSNNTVFPIPPKQIGGLKLVDDLVIAYTTPGKGLYYHVFDEEQVNTVFSVPLRSIYDPEFNDLIPPQTWYLLGGNNGVQSYYTKNQIETNQGVRLEDYSKSVDILTGCTHNPFVGAAASQGFPLLTGYGSPTRIGDSIYLPYISGYILYTGSNRRRSTGTTMLKFSTNGGNILFDGVVANYKNETVFSCKYDGKYLWTLSVDNLADSANPELQRRNMYISRQYA